ncbi:MAG: hypothetical protein JWL94_594 [Microbacteriaceae bacterium]|jgi:hypothetical protein|nr:hypothetical protein [Microbacteriaceae bacterium]HEV7956570.1 hypothetical protein [Marisediminicola sp.]
MDVLTTPAPQADPLAAADIVFHALSDTEWRVTDRRFPTQSIEALLGFVAKKGAFFYATRMHRPFEAEPLPSLDRVAEFFVAHRGR